MNPVLTMLHDSIGITAHRIEAAEKTNEQRDEYLRQRDIFKEKLIKVQQYLDSINTLFKGTQVAMERYRMTTIENLESRMEVILAAVLPEEDFKVRITYEPVRNKMETRILLGKTQQDGEIIWADPRVQNGDFIKQLVSFSAVASINLLLHSRFLFIDEPFSSSDVTNVKKLKPIIELLQEQGLQLLFIEHKPELYNSMQHNLIKLYKHRSPVDKDGKEGGFVQVVSVERIIPNDTDKPTIEQK